MTHWKRRPVRYRYKNTGIHIDPNESCYVCRHFVDFPFPRCLQRDENIAYPHRSRCQEWEKDE